MARTVSQKMGLVEGMRAYFKDAPSSALDAMKLPLVMVSGSLKGTFDYLHLFVISERGLDKNFPSMAKHLRQGGMFWVSWPKSRQLGTDLTLPKVIRIGYSHGLVESTTLSIDEVWSAIKFTHPKPGKAYNNSFGELPA